MHFIEKLGLFLFEHAKSIIIERFVLDVDKIHFIGKNFFDQIFFKCSNFNKTYFIENNFLVDHSTSIIRLFLNCILLKGIF
jgi:hypothetical protein